MEGDWSCYRGGHFNGGRMVHVTEVASLMEGEKSCYRGGHFNGGRMVTLQVTLMEGKWSCCRGGQFSEGEWSCYCRWSL